MLQQRLSDARVNMMKWYPFSADANCLIVGEMDSDMVCGIRENVRSVSVVKTVEECNPSLRYDYVCLYECLTENLLQIVKEKLLPQGKILIFSDNRIGLRYFSGEKNVHGNTYFSNWDGKDSNEGAVWGYTKEELCEQLQQAGFYTYKFYYLYPDPYQLKEVFTDETLEEFDYGRDYYNYRPGTMELFSEQRVSQIFLAEGIMPQFANYFLVETGLEGTESPVLYAKINSFRKKQFQIATIIEKDGAERKVKKIGLSEGAVKHVKRVMQYGNTEDMQELPLGVLFRYYTSCSLDQLLRNLIEKRSVEQIYASISNVFQPYFENAKPCDYHTPEFIRVFGKEDFSEAERRTLDCICPANIDLICDNIMLEPDGYRFIDEEWVFDFEIPVLFILWRCVRELYAKHVKLSDLVPYREFLMQYHITDEMDRVFLRWASHFVEEYVGTKSSEREAIARIPVNLWDVYLDQGNAARSILYYDTGTGYSEKQICQKLLQTDADGRFLLSFPIPANTRRVRWAPVKIRHCWCRIDEINGKVVSYNGSESDDGQLFQNGDPQYEIEFEDNLPFELNIQGMIQIKDLRTTAKKFAQDQAVLSGNAEAYLGERDELRRTCEMLRDAYGILEEKYVSVSREYDRIIHSRSWRLIVWIKKILRRG